MFKKTRLKRFCSFLLAIAVLCGTFVLNPQTVMAATEDIYVSNTGSDGANGSFATPVLTLQGAINVAAQPDVTIHVMSNINTNVIPLYATIPPSITDLTIISDSGGPFTINGYIESQGPKNITLDNVKILEPLNTNQHYEAIAFTGTPTDKVVLNTVNAVEIKCTPPDSNSDGALDSNVAINNAVDLTINGTAQIYGGTAAIFSAGKLTLNGTGMLIQGGDGFSKPGVPSASNGNFGITIYDTLTIGGDLKIFGGDSLSTDPAAYAGDAITLNGKNLVISDDAPTDSTIEIKGGDSTDYNGGFGISDDNIFATTTITFEEIPAKFDVKGGRDMSSSVDASAIKLSGGTPNIIYPAGFPVINLAYSIPTPPPLNTGGGPVYTMVNTTITGTAVTDIVIPTVPAPVTITAPAHAPADTSVLAADIQYQWEKSTDGGTTWTVLTAADTDYSGINTTSLTIQPTSLTQGHQYRCGLGNHLYSPTATLKSPEPTPAASIDYINETLTNLVPGANYIINSVPLTAGPTGEITIDDANWMGAVPSITKVGIVGNNTTDSAPQLLTVPARPLAPSVASVNETIAGLSDGQITGTSAQLEYKLSTDTTWTACTGTTVTGLAPGIYNIREVASQTDPNFLSNVATVTILTGGAPTYTLNVTAPTFTPVSEGYTQPAAQPIVINNSGNSASTISSVAVNTSDFIIGGSGTTVATGGSLSTWTVQPAAGLSNGTYTDTITVTYNNGATATATVTFVVNPTFTATTVSDPVAGGTATIAIGSGTPSSSVTDLPGTTATINATPATDYTFDHWEVSDPNVVLANPATSASNSFVLPSSNVTVTAYYNEIPNTITVNASPAVAGTATVTVGNVTGQTASSISNTNIGINVITNYGYQFDHWDVNGSAITLNDPATDSNNSFNMINSNVTLTAYFVPATQHNINITTNIVGAGTPIATTSSSIAATTALATDSVTINAMPAVGYDFLGWTVINPSGLTLGNDGMSVTSFIMPASNVEIMANYRLTPVNTPSPTNPPSGNKDPGDGNDEKETTIYATPTPEPIATQKPTIEPTHKPNIDSNINDYDKAPIMSGYPDRSFRPKNNITRAEVSQVIYNVKYDGETLEDSPYTDVESDVWYENAINFAYAENYMVGYPDGTFRPDEPITRAEALTVIDSMTDYDAYEGENLFTDIEGHWATDKINSVSYTLDLQGYPDGTYKPDDYIIRGDFAIIIAKATNRVDYSPEVTFNDVFESDYYYEEVMAVTNPAK